MKLIITTIFCTVALFSHGQSFKLSKKEKSGLEIISANQATYNEWLIKIGGIISPSGQELERAKVVSKYMQQIGLLDVQLDGTPNAIGVIPGRIDSCIVFVSTLDDLAGVAENQRKINTGPYVESNKVVGPGTNTSSITVAMIAAAEAIITTGIVPYYTLVFAAVAQEETGLVGMKHIYDKYKEQTALFVDILGDGHSISYGALGIHWWKVVATGPSEHTLRSGWPGLPHVNQSIGRAVDQILQLPQPNEYRDLVTRINVGMIQSGNVYNHKPSSGYFTLDIRSLDESIIVAIEADIRSILEEITEQTEIGFSLEPFQIMPGGQIAGFSNSKVVRTAAQISNYLGYEPRLSNAGSSNMNVALSKGHPAIGLGGNRGGNRGFEDEFADSDAMVRSAKHVFLLATKLR